jgi:prepilin-type N-terminal cleavage/methylation domain-containing protein
MIELRTIRRRRARGGYTLVEVMMSLAVFAIGVGGMIGMQKVAISSNQHAKNLALATHIGQAWLDELAADAGQWNEAADFDETTWLGEVGGEDEPPGEWFRPDYSSGRNFGPAFDALGSPVATLDFATNAHFCSDVRLTWLYRQVRGKEGGGLIRAQVRVFWRREGLRDVEDPPLHACDVTPLEFDQGGADRLYHVVYLSTALRQNFLEE